MNEEVKNGIIFDRGPKNDAYAQYFTGQTWPLNQVAATIGIFIMMDTNFCLWPVEMVYTKKMVNQLDYFNQGMWWLPMMVLNIGMVQPKTVGSLTSQSLLEHQNG